MEQNPGNERRPKSTVENGRWFSLPDDIIQNIVSRLDFPGNSVITFSETVFTIDIPERKSIRSNWRILDNLFTIFCSPLVTYFYLRLCYTFYREPCSSTILDSWLRNLRARNNLQHLCLRCNNCNFQQFYPQTISRIPSLVSLDIDSGISGVIPLLCPNPITLPKLKKLNIGSVNCYRSLEWILRLFPSLESLSFNIVHEQPNWKDENGPVVVIAGKNLKQLFLRLESESIIEVTIDAPKLEEFHYSSNTFVSMQMFDSISHVKSIHLFMGNTTRVYHSRRPTKIVFRNLALVKYSCKNDSYEFFGAIVSMLQFSPNLDVLDLLIDYCHMIWILEARFARIIQHVKLIKLRLWSVCFDKLMKNLVTYLLRSAPVLEKLVIDGFYNGFEDNKSIIARFQQTVLKCPKASSSCEVEFLRGYQLE